MTDLDVVTINVYRYLFSVTPTMTAEMVTFLMRILNTARIENVGLENSNVLMMVC